MLCEILLLLSVIPFAVCAPGGMGWVSPCPILGADLMNTGMDDWTSQGRDVSTVSWGPKTLPESSLCLKGALGMGSKVKGWGMQI